MPLCWSARSSCVWRPPRQRESPRHRLRPLPPHLASRPRGRAPLQPGSPRSSCGTAKSLAGSTGVFSSFLENVLDSEPQPEPVAPAPAPQPVEEKPQEPQPAAPVQEQLPLPVEEQPPVETPQSLRKEFHSRVIGEAFGTYLLVEYSADELMFIDKHAAHERLLYERLKRENAGGEAQTLLEPVTVTLDKEEYTAALDHLEDFSKAGFEVEDFGSGTVLVRSAPLLLDGGDAAEAVMEIAGYLASLKKPHDHRAPGLGLPQRGLPRRHEGRGFHHPGGDGVPGPGAGAKPRRALLPPRPAGVHHPAPPGHRAPVWAGVI